MQASFTKVVSCELVVARSDTPTMLNFIEEPLDQVTRSVKERAEADRILAIAFRRYVCPRALANGERPDPVRVISSICQQHGSRRNPVRSTEQSRLSCTSPAASPRRTGKPL